MKITFLRSVMKKAINTCMSISDNKNDAKVWIRSFTETDILLYTQRDDKGIKYFHHIKTVTPLEFAISFVVNPFELESLFKGKLKERTVILEENDGVGILYSTEDETTHLQVNVYNGKFPLSKLPYIPLNNTTEFRYLLDEIIKAASKEVDVVEIGGYEAALKAPPIYLKRFNLLEDFPKFIFPLDYIQQLKKNIIWPKSNMNRISQCSYQNELYIRIESENEKKPNEMFRQLFVLKQKDSNPPVAKQLEESIVHSFKINTEDFWETLNDYPATVTDVYLYDRNGDLVIDPYDKSGEPLDEETEEQAIYHIEYTGQLKRTKVDRNGLMALLSGYVGEQNIDVVQYKENDNKSFALRIYDKYLYSIVAAKKEPNYAKIQERLNKQLEYEKTLSFLSD